MIIAINGRIFPTTGLIKGAETAAFLHRLLDPSPDLSPRLQPAVTMKSIAVSKPALEVVKND